MSEILGRLYQGATRAGRLAEGRSRPFDFVAALAAAAAAVRAPAALALVMESMPKLVWTADPSGEVTFFNRRWVDYTGVTVEQARGGAWRQVIHPDDADALAAAWQNAMRTGEPMRMEHRVRG